MPRQLLIISSDESWGFPGCETRVRGNASFGFVVAILDRRVSGGWKGEKLLTLVLRVYCCYVEKSYFILCILLRVYVNALWVQCTL